MTDKISKSDDQWKTELDREAYRVLRERGTEPAFTGKYVDHKESGDYVCAGCGNVLFSSRDKFDSGTGWPSFSEIKNLDSVETRLDTDLGVPRTEVICKRCGGHLGHVFDDGPTESGKRYCINSCALDFKKE